MRPLRWLLLALGLLALPPAVFAEQSPRFELPGLSQESVRLSDYRGQLVAVNFWAPWCPPCRAEIPELVAFHRAYEDTVVLGLALDSKRKAVRKMADMMEIPYPVAYATNQTAQAFGGVRAFPTTFFIGPEGEVAAEHRGPLSAQQLEDYRRRILDPEAED